MEQSRVILAYLTALRRTVRRRLVTYGLFAVVASGVPALLTVIILDWLFWLPPLLRTAGGLTFVAGFVGATLHWVVRPLRARVGIDELAGELERRFRALQDRLSSTVNFLERRDAGSAAMMRQVIAETEQTIRELPLGAALSIRPLAVRGAVFATGLVVLGAVVGFAPEWSQTGLYRYLHPWGAIEWPRTVAIVPLTGGQTVALGESATVRM